MIVGYRDGQLRCFDTLGAKAQIWDVSMAHKGAVTAIYADQNYILTGGQDGAVRVWNRRTRQLLIQFNGKSSLSLCNFVYFVLTSFSFSHFTKSPLILCNLVYSF